MKKLLAPLFNMARLLVQAFAVALGVVGAIARPALRFVGALMLLAATIALTSDLTNWQTSGVGWTFDSLTHHIATLAPTTLKNIAAGIGNATHPWLWDPVLTSLLAQPAWIIFLIAGSLLLYTGRERHKINIFVN